MARIWAVYDSADDLQDRLRERLRAHPEFGRLLDQAPPDPAEQARTRALLRAAMLDGAWEPYWAYVRAQAEGYANAEISFASWAELINIVRCDLLERLADGDAAPVADVKALDRWLDDALAVFGQAFVSANEQVIAHQQRAIRQLSTPVLQLRPGLLILPIVGALDIERLRQLRAELLDGVRARRARAVVLDITGVPEIDSVAANELIAAVSGARMMGAAVIISGLSAEIAQTLVTVGIDLGRVVSTGDLQSGIEEAEARLRRL